MISFFNIKIFIIRKYFKKYSTYTSKRFLNLALFIILKMKINKPAIYNDQNHLISKHMFLSCENEYYLVKPLSNH